MNRIIFTSFIIVVFGLGISFAHAQTSTSTIVDVRFPGQSDSSSVQEYIANMYKFALAIAGFLALAMITWGAIVYTTSAGSPDRQNEGKDIIISALWGVLLLVGSYLILNTINPRLTRLGEGFFSTSTGSGLGGFQCPLPGQPPAPANKIYIAQASSTAPNGYICKLVDKPLACSPQVLAACPQQLTNIQGRISGYGPQPATRNAPEIVGTTNFTTGIISCKNFNSVTCQSGWTNNQWNDVSFSNGTIWLYPYYPEGPSTFRPPRPTGPSEARCIIYAYKTDNRPTTKIETTTKTGLLHC